MHTTNRPDAIAATPEHLIDFIVVTPFDAPAFHERVAERFGITAVRFTVLLNRAIESPRGIAHDPFTCRLLRERRERNARSKVRLLA